MSKLKPCPQEHCGGHLIPSYDRPVCHLCGRSASDAKPPEKPTATPAVARVGSWRLP
jgi:hypothetical protein